MERLRLSTRWIPTSWSPKTSRRDPSLWGQIGPGRRRAVEHHVPDRAGRSGKNAGQRDAAERLGRENQLWHQDRLQPCFHYRRFNPYQVDCCRPGTPRRSSSRCCGARTSNDTRPSGTAYGSLTPIMEYGSVPAVNIDDYPAVKSSSGRILSPTGKAARQGARRRTTFATALTTRTSPRKSCSGWTLPSRAGSHTMTAILSV